MSDEGKESARERRGPEFAALAALLSGFSIFVGGLYDWMYLRKIDSVLPQFASAADFLSSFITFLPINIALLTVGSAIGFILRKWVDEVAPKDLKIKRAGDRDDRRKVFLVLPLLVIPFVFTSLRSLAVPLIVLTIYFPALLVWFINRFSLPIDKQRAFLISGAIFITMFALGKGHDDARAALAASADTHSIKFKDKESAEPGRVLRLYSRGYLIKTGDWMPLEEVESIYFPKQDMSKVSLFCQWTGKFC